MLLHPKDETPITIYRLTRRNVTENFSLQQHRCENLNISALHFYRWQMEQEDYRLRIFR